MIFSAGRWSLAAIFPGTNLHAIPWKTLTCQVTFLLSQAQMMPTAIYRRNSIGNFSFTFYLPALLAGVLLVVGGVLGAALCPKGCTLCSDNDPECWSPEGNVL
jgi:hypothetical protein